LKKYEDLYDTKTEGRQRDAETGRPREELQALMKPPICQAAWKSSVACFRKTLGALSGKLGQQPSEAIDRFEAPWRRWA